MAPLHRLRRPATDRVIPGAEVWPGLNSVDELARTEAVLFLAREPLSTRKLAKLAGLADGTKARALIDQLRERLTRSGSAMELVDVAGGVQMTTRPQLADWLARREGADEANRLSAAAMETLAVTAYRQPVLRADIEAIRGVQCGEILKVLMERGLLRIVGRSEELGRPYLYGTTRKFLQTFGLQRLEHLPPIDQTLSAEKNSRDDPPEALPDMRRRPRSENPMPEDTMRDDATLEKMPTGKIVTAKE